MSSIPLVVIVGPTAVGKTALSIELAKKIDGEIISGDAIQVYKGMDIGSAKITYEEMDGIPHHLIDILNPDESYSAAQFKQMTEKLIIEIHNRGHVPMIVGGTGLYIQSVLFDYGFTDENQDAAKEYEKQFEAMTADERFELLQKVDPSAAQVIHRNNQQRVLRALTYYHLHQTSITNQTRRNQIVDCYDVTLIGLTRERSNLYQRINQRVDKMIEAGLLEEVSKLKAAGYENARSMTAIGYKEIISYLNNELALQEAKEKLKQNSRRFAKRQMTWFHNQMDLYWYDTEQQSTESIIASVLERMNRK
ncbi:tRNA (adenosine(37)-N6)-dimethylallyltransferase MiaA [Macrococcus hajekii]|uniref:tRNA dimethylallyltransferase n=1 Tax=Macrococcus hajekii TaxID=198482 RepID=A0A4R6BMP3_9STAP|nr:tRNA (adenosine(37)-N6)-dimethylallyltransferase MiaA [Macrococcus hajekii]TDM03114.1 tRNA (adenosine(37)-N6)-dimethylallyltransferase MiaA [Macrococcus hajekii]GGA96099.1 tRNA dimethylallyltransferase [Macrococcus hajekii]